MNVLFISFALMLFFPLFFLLCDSGIYSGIVLILLDDILCVWRRVCVSIPVFCCSFLKLAGYGLR